MKEPAVRIQATGGEGQGVGDWGLGVRILPICSLERSARRFQMQKVGSMEENVPVPLGDGRSLIILNPLFYDQETVI